MQTDDTALEQLGDNRPASYRGLLRDDRLARELYSEGAGIARTLPLAVAVPQDAPDVIELIQWARRSAMSLMPRGSASGMAAGAIGPGIAVDLSQFKTIGDVDVGHRRIRVGAGAVRGEVEQAASTVGLRFPVDPSSGAFCTIGGMVGANASGARTLRFGSTRPWVTGLECVFDDGSMAWIRRGEALPTQIPAVARLSHALAVLRSNVNRAALVHAGVRKESSGYAIDRALQEDGSLIDLLVGSEGTLAVFTQVELALTAAAGATGTVLALFDSLEAATECALLASGLGAAACELLDRTFLEVAASKGASGVPSNVEAVLLIEMEAENASAVANETASVSALLKTRGARDVVVGLSTEAQHELWKLRHAASPILSSLAPQLRSMQFIEDGCVPPANLPAYVRGVRAVLQRYEFRGVIFGHAGDSHMHVNPLVDVYRSGWRDRVRGALLDVCELTHQLGGTLSGEHGDGRLRAPLLAHVWSAEARAAFANIKAAADPAGVLNAGCKIAAAQDNFSGELRHDPTARPLSDEARGILDRIERERAWNCFRLGALDSREDRTANETGAD
ncbi:MAG: FAD-binding oxidoreductase [Gemmatimonadaceae bacterium]